MKIQLSRVLKCSSSALLLASLVNSPLWAMEEDANDKNPAYIRFQQDKEYEDALQNDFSRDLSTLSSQLQQLEQHPCFKILTEISETKSQLNNAIERTKTSPDNPNLQRKVTTAQETLAKLENNEHASKENLSKFQDEWIAIRKEIKTKAKQIEEEEKNQNQSDWTALKQKTQALRSQLEKSKPYHDNLQRRIGISPGSNLRRIAALKLISLHTLGEVIEEGNVIVKPNNPSAENLLRALSQYVIAAGSEPGSESIFPHVNSIFENWVKRNQALLEFIGYEDGNFNTKLFSPDTLQNGFLVHPKKLHAFLAKFKQAPEGLSPLDFNRFAAACLRLRGANRKEDAEKLFENWIFSEKNLPLIKMAICHGDGHSYWPEFTIRKNEIFFQHFLTHPAHLREFLTFYDFEEMYDESSEKYKANTNRHQIPLHVSRDLELIVKKYIQQNSDKPLMLSPNSSQPLLVPRSLAKCTSLKDLRLRGSRYTDRGFEIFPTLELRTLPHLTKLSITEAKLGEIPAVLFTLGSLTVLILDENGISEIPSAIASFKNLRKLLMNKNSLHTVAPEIGQLSFLEVLELSSQGPWVWHAGHTQDEQTSRSLSHIPDEIGNLVNLKKLVLDNNDLTEFPDLRNLTQLKELTLHHNKLAHLEDSFCNFPFAVVDLSHNELTEISRWVPYTVTELNLSHNHISKITSDIGKRTQLKSLNLQNNNLQKKDAIDPAFFALPRLTSLDLSYSDAYEQGGEWNEILDELPEDIGKLTTLQSLKVTANKLPKAIVGLFFKNLTNFWHNCRERDPQLTVLLSLKETLKLRTPSLLRAYFKLMRPGNLEKEFGVNLEEDESKKSSEKEEETKE